jgi:ParB family chromosome partitioning protein
MRLDVQKHGLMMPVLLEPVGRKYKILDGLLRCRVAQHLGHETVPAIVRQLDEETAWSNLDTLLKTRHTAEHWHAYKTNLMYLMINTDYTTAMLAARLGRTSTWVRSVLNGEKDTLP